MKQYLAIDVGGTSTKYALVSEQGELAEKHKQPTATVGLNLWRQ